MITQAMFELPSHNKKKHLMFLRPKSVYDNKPNTHISLHFPHKASLFDVILLREWVLIVLSLVVVPVAHCLESWLIIRWKHRRNNYV